MVGKLGQGAPAESCHAWSNKQEESLCHFTASILANVKIQSPIRFTFSVALTNRRLQKREKERMATGLYSGTVIAGSAQLRVLTVSIARTACAPSSAPRQVGVLQDEAGALQVAFAPEALAFGVGLSHSRLRSCATGLRSGKGRAHVMSNRTSHDKVRWACRSIQPIYEYFCKISRIDTSF